MWDKGQCMVVSMSGGGTDCACPTCIDGEECPPCDCGEEEPFEETIEEGYCVPAGWSEIIEDAGGLEGAGSYDDARDAMAGEIWGDNGATGGDDKDLQLSAPEAAGASDGADEASAAGCATGQAAGAAPMMILFIAFMALAVLPRRRTVPTRTR